MAKEIGEVGIKIKPNFDIKAMQEVLKSASNKIKSSFKTAFDGINKTFSKGGAFLTGLNSGLQVVKEIAGVLGKLENSVKDATAWGGNLSDFAQSVGFKAGEEAKLTYILSQLAAGGIGQENSMRLIEELTKRISSGEVVLEKGLSTPDAIASAFAMMQGLQGPERLKMFRKLFGENVLLSGDIDAAITAYGTHSAARLGAVGTYEGYKAVQAGLEQSDFAQSEIEVRRVRGELERVAALGRRSRVIDPETGFASADIVQAIVDAEAMRQESRKKEIEEANAAAIKASAETLVAIEKMMIKASGWIGSFAEKTIGLLEKMAGVKDESGKKWWNPATWDNEPKKEL